jgi:hypothetical protein
VQTHTSCSLPRCFFVSRSASNKRGDAAMESTFVRSLLFSLLLALLLVILGPTPVTQAAANLNVDRFDDPAVTVGGAGAAACTPAENDCSLRGAILLTNASLGDAFVINIPTGTYTLTLTGAGEDYNLTGDLDITHNVTIAGAGASATIINANNLDRVLDARTDNTDNTDNIRISGVTIKGGHAPDGAVATSIAGGGSGENGGGIRNTASLTLTNVIVTANHAGAGGAGGADLATKTAYPGGPGGMGGGIYNTGALTVISTTISSNSAGEGGVGGSGGAARSPNPGAWGGNGGDGGGIYNSGTLTVTGTIVQSNHAGRGGNGGAGSGGIPIAPATGAPGASGGDGGNGGGIYNASNLSLARSTIASNVTGDGGLGGAGGAGSGAPQSGIAGRDGGAGGNGGKAGNGSAISNTGQAMVMNSTLSGNTAGNGGAGANGGKGGDTSGAIGGNGGDGGSSGSGGSGGIHNYNSLLVAATFTVTSATVTANTTGNRGIPGSGGAGGAGNPNGNNGSPGSIGTTGTGGGVALYGGTLSFKNTILANNTTPPFGQGPDCFGTLTSQGYNLIRTPTGCTVGGSSMGNIIGQDPKLNALADNGGGTLTHALQLSSPAINAADPAGCRDGAGALLSVDQRGLPRAYGGRCDIGAFELQGSGLFLPLLRR